MEGNSQNGGRETFSDLLICNTKHKPPEIDFSSAISIRVFAAASNSGKQQKLWNCWFIMHGRMWWRWVRRRKTKTIFISPFNPADEKVFNPWIETRGLSERFSDKSELSFELLRQTAQNHNEDCRHYLLLRRDSSFPRATRITQHKIGSMLTANMFVFDSCLSLCESINWLSSYAASFTFSLWFECWWNKPRKSYLVGGLSHGPWLCMRLFQCSLLVVRSFALGAKRFSQRGFWIVRSCITSWNCVLQYTRRGEKTARYYSSHSKTLTRW